MKKLPRLHWHADRHGIKRVKCSVGGLPNHNPRLLHAGQIRLARTAFFHNMSRRRILADLSIGKLKTVRAGTRTSQYKLFTRFDIPPEFVRSVGICWFTPPAYILPKKGTVNVPEWTTLIAFDMAGLALGAPSTTTRVIAALSQVLREYFLSHCAS